MNEVIDLAERRKAREDEGEYIIVCDCGCAMFRIYASGEVMCLNCEAEMLGISADTSTKKD